MKVVTDYHIENIEAIIKTGRILIDESDRFSYSFDGSFGTYLPDIVIQTKSVDELASLVKFANCEKIPICPRGQATSLSGGPLPVKGGIVIDLSIMNDLLEIHEEDLIAIVSPGVLTSDIHKAAEQKGLMYPPDPSSSHVSTIAGNLAENSGGPRGLKYGVTKDYVIGLEIITPEGEIIKTGGKTVKNVTGYDLTKLIVGSEGTLGIITKAILRLIPKPQASGTIMAIFDNLVDAGSAISKILSSGILPSKMELMDQSSIVAVENFEPLGLPTDAAALILIELDGHPLSLKEEMEQAAVLCRTVGAREVTIPKNKAEETELWKARKLVSPAIARIKPTKISEDATVPRSKIPEMCERLLNIRDKYGIHLVVFGHAGDGNLHPNIICDKTDQEEMIRVEQAVAEIFTAAVELGGTLSGEHGIGTMKAPFMEMELGAVGLDMMKRIKKAWDPNNIMNPGKIFPEPGQKLELR
ncbi:FAD-linked oxidase C-terminal domain-containing protein [Bacillus sp. FSL W8-0920]|uniref:FAD-binding protein n=1 Tax=Bacillus zhangzhouensis TaxID=1178540 RepID=A0A081LDP4_9BACI|nr:MULTISPECIES: FAD-linked oxidase C-terminal domain-containing protein [Bacillus]KEP27370.1 FAD-binding protein [Bacillus zhangzhouensis]MBR0590467.1 FAD-binding protein [Bacillus pumilus sxm20-2]MDR0121834.1 FAD-linked oxidase C-terminal domain-containing protein [Bacillus pumilus]MED1526668.1 FAD-linked oxidase C-terminal domain-containing protein [Bacillus pumilus]UDF14882.1 FAD-binding protein [Bacillus pumilus]